MWLTVDSVTRSGPLNGSRPAMGRPRPRISLHPTNPIFYRLHLATQNGFEGLFRSNHAEQQGTSTVVSDSSIHTKPLFRLDRRLLHLDYEIVGALPRTGPALIAMKHQSTWETLKLHLIFDRPAIVLKQELLGIPLWGRFAATLDMIPIDRSARAAAW